MTLEKRVSKRNRLTGVQKAIMAMVGATGLLAVGAVAPNVIQYLPKQLMNKLDSREEHKFKRSRNELVRRGYLKFSNKVGGYELTPQGRLFLDIAQGIEKKKWDKKWRLLIFDISEKRKSGRDTVRYKLAQFGLVRLQDSVWVYPYPCDEFIALLKMELKLGKNLLYLITDEFEGEDDLLKHFKLAR